MKFTPVILTVSLIANVVLAIAVMRRSSPPDAAAVPRTSSVSKRTVSSDPAASALRAALASGDAAGLEAAGLPADAVRQLLLGRAFNRFAERMRATQSPAPDGRWWRNRGPGAGNREDMLLARRELSDAMLAAFGDDFGFGGGDGSQLSFLPVAKREALRRITQDYDEMMAKFSASGVQLPSDREKLRLLRAERDRDVATLLTPAELADYELRMSATAGNVRARYGDAIESEDDFRKLFALQKAFDEKFPREAFTGRVTPEFMQQRSAAERQLQDEMRAALGDEKFAALRRASDTDLRNVESLATRLNLPADTTTRVAGTRDNYAVESQRISADAALNPTQRRAQLQDLGTRAKSDLVRTLGAEAAEAYGQRAPWVSMLQGGIAFSTNPKDAPPGAPVGLGGQSVFPVMPAGSTPPGATRQVVNIVSGGTSGAPTEGGTFLFQGTPPQTRENTQVISVVTGGHPTTPPSGTPPPSSSAPAPAPPPPR